MAVNAPAFRRKFPLLFTSSLLAVSAAPLLQADEQYNCQANASGGWSCSTQDAARAIPRPQSSVPEASSPSAQDSGHTARARRQANPYEHLDWVPRSQLTAAQLAEIAPYCGGAYVEPERLTSQEGRDSPTFLSARASRYDQQNQIATLAGDVIMRQGSLQAEADEANFYQLQNRGELRGSVRLRDEGMLLSGSRAEINLENGEAQVDDAYYVAHDASARGKADYVKRREDSVIMLKGGTYTRCEPGDNTWRLQGNNIKLDPRSGFGTATNVTLRVKDVPVFYTPYISFPIDDRRQSGFLPPSISTSGDTGLALKTPYYLNLAPNYDATLYPTWMSNRGLLMEGEFRYLTADSAGQVGGAWLDDQEDERKLQSEYEDQRWMVSWQHHTRLSERLTANVDYTDISDPYYFQDLDTGLGIDTPSHLNQRAGLTWRGDSFTAALKVHAYERATVTDITPYDRLPQLTILGHLPWEPAGLQARYKAEYTSFDRDLRSGDFIDEDGNAQAWYDTRIRGLARATGERTHLAPQISLPLETTWGYLRPTIKYTWTHYDLDIDQRGLDSLRADQEFSSTQNRSLPIYSLDSGLYFDREAQWFGNHYRQTLEPRAFYLYAAEKDQSDLPIFDSRESSFSYDSLWRDNRFTGSDRIGDENKLSLGLTSRWLEGNGFERQRISLGQALYFSDRKVQMPGIDYSTRSDATASQSPYALQYQYRFNRDWRLSADLNWDPDTSSTRSGSSMFHYQPEKDPRRIINAGYRYRNDRMHYDRASGTWVVGDGDFGRPGDANYIKDYYKIVQHDISTIWPIGPQWSLIARWQYDYNRNRTLEAFGGFEYDSCCWKVRLVNRYWMDYNENSLNPDLNDEADNGIFLQLVFKGLGDITGTKVESFLDKGIQGYRRRENEAY